MKTTLFLAAVALILLGCDQQPHNHPELDKKLETIQSKLESERKPIRWATANKREIESALSKWNRQKMDEAKKAEALPPEVEEQVRQYETLQSAFFRKHMEAMRPMPPVAPGASPFPAPSDDLLALSNRVAEAKAPVAEIIDRRARQSTAYREQYNIEKLVSEYANDRFDLVVDSSDQAYRSPVLHRTATEVLDITDGILKFLDEKTKQ
ncbi:MAG: hypothetical protein H0X66_14070 [Verrucomicrobia bacterium]|nr:hypothetical protein [Verrucomicrobiota bacterium]